MEPTGIVEVITLLLGLSGFGLQANPKAPTPDQSLQYAMPDPDVVVHFDVAAVVPGNYKVLQNLPESATDQGLAHPGEDGPPGTR